MIKRRKFVNIIVYGGCAVCMFLAWDNESGMEFGGGTLTGPITKICGIGALLFLVTLLTMFGMQRLTSCLAILSIALCLPLPTYLLMPGAYQVIFPGFYSVPSKHIFQWSKEGFVDLMFLGIAASITVLNIKLNRK